MSQSRQLAAIMFTDMVGYTGLMGEDEQKAFMLLNKNRHLQKPIIEQYAGKWIKELGDGVLASFTTVSDAVSCAIAIQERCNQDHDFKLRIGIHQGEVVFESDDIFGDAVNIASRLQALAPEGGIWVSESVHHNISNKQGVRAKFVKEAILKNVKEPVRIYEILTMLQVEKSISISKPEKQNTPKKSIAVLPFVNMSSDPEQEFFSDGLTEDIITDLSRLKELLVISRSSMMTFKGTQKKIKEIAADVNAHYVLEGSVRRAGNNLRITAQLIEAQNDVHLWAERYNGTVDDVFDIQEKVSRSIVEALHLTLTKEEDSHLSEHPIKDLQAYECYVRARQEIWKLSEEGFENATALAQRGLDLVGDNAVLYATLGLAHLFMELYGFKSNPSYLEKAQIYSSKSLELDPDCLQAHFVQSAWAHRKGNMQEAAKRLKMILDKDPNSPEALHFLIVCCFIRGKPLAGQPFAEKLLQIDPMTNINHAFPGFLQLFNGNMEAALPYYEKWLQMDPGGPFTRYWCAVVFALNKKLNDSIQVLVSLIRDMPDSVYGRFAHFFKSALQGDRENALKYATEELRTFFLMPMAWGFTLINEKDEAVKRLQKTLDYGYSPYPLLLKWETFQRELTDHPGFQAYMQEIKKRSEMFSV